MSGQAPGQAFAVPAGGAVAVRACEGSTLVVAFAPGLDPERAAEAAEQLHEGSGLKVAAVADVTAVRAWHPHELTALRDEIAAVVLELRAGADAVRPSRLAELKDDTAARLERILEDT